VLARTRTADAAEKLGGVIRLQAGTVLLVRAACPADQSFDLAITATAEADGSGGRVTLCGTTAIADRYNAAPGDKVPVGEGYLLIRETGDYAVAVATGSGTATFVSVDLFADATPTVVSAAVFAASGYSGTLTAPADTVLIWVKPGDKGGSWLLDGAKSLCAAEFYGPAPADLGATNLGGVCRHHVEVSIGPFTGEIPLVVFARSAGTFPIRISRKG
jgi:hypothetical protein